MIPNLIARWKRHPLLDAIIYKASHKLATYDTIRFNLWITRHRPKQISQLAPIIIRGCPKSETTLTRTFF